MIVKIAIHICKFGKWLLEKKEIYRSAMRCLRLKIEWKTREIEDSSRLKFVSICKKCHWPTIFFCSQHVERFVALTSKAAEHAIGHQNRHRWILNKMKSTKQIPIASAKKEDFFKAADATKRETAKKKLCTEKNE